MVAANDIALNLVGMQDMRSKRKLKVPESEFKDGPQGLKCAAPYPHCCFCMCLMPCNDAATPA